MLLEVNGAWPIQAYSFSTDSGKGLRVCSSIQVAVRNDSQSRHGTAAIWGTLVEVLCGHPEQHAVHGNRLAFSLQLGFFLIKLQPFTNDRAIKNGSNAWR